MRALLSILLLLGASVAQACSCVPYDIDEAFKKYDMVFRGTVGKIGGKYVWEEGVWWPRKLSRVKLNVSRVYKSEVGEEITVYTERYTESCGFPFQKNTEYVVFAYIGTEEAASHGVAVAGKPMVSGCSPTIHFQEGESYYEEERLSVVNYLESEFGS